MTSEDAPTTSLVDELGDQGELVAEGGFSVDIRQAGTKLQAFRLAEPGAWIVLLLEGAIAAGSSRVEIEIRRGELELHFHELALQGVELDRLAVVLASSPRDHESREHALHLLGLAYQAAQARVDGLLIESGTRRLRWTKAGESLDELDQRAHTRVLVELGDPEPEHRLVLERCAYAAIDVLVEGEPVAWGWRGAFGSRESPAALLPCPDPELLRIDDRVAGLVGFAFERVEGATLYVLMKGILIETIELEGPPARRCGFVAVVEAPDLGRDLGLTKVLRDERFARLLTLVEAAWERIYEEHDGEALRLRKPPTPSPRGSSLPLALGVLVALILVVILLTLM